jgi:hypothetical protein
MDPDLCRRSPRIAAPRGSDGAKGDMRSVPNALDDARHQERMIVR